MLTQSDLMGFLRFMVAATLFVTLVLGGLFFAKNVIWGDNVPAYDCLKGHEQVEQVDQYGKRDVVFVCDETRIK